MDFHKLNLLTRYAKEYGHSKIRVAGMSDTEHTICTCLFAHDGMSQDDVSQALRLDKTTVARALLTLEEKGFIRRTQNPENRRKNLLSITDEGKNSIAEVVHIYDEWFAHISSCLSQEEQRQFDEYCGRLLAAAREISEEN
ncbi:MAG: MarR family transcriptional regulator [Oscillospiraceae bacterium]|nr:MarR family transcriptional regulator [Oscillospiraceae bacterium]